MSEFTLNNFQKKMVDHIVDYFKEHNVYLLADETGIGKTVIASEVARRLTDNAKIPQSVLYIASNLDLANENIEKLKFEGSEAIRGRLSTLWKNFENEKSCDFLLVNDSSKKAYFIELKGENIDEAIDQLEASEKRFAPELKGYTFLYRIVCSKALTHKIQKPTYLKFKEKCGMKLKTKERILEETLA